MRYIETDSEAYSIWWTDESASYYPRREVQHSHNGTLVSFHVNVQNDVIGSQ